MDKINAWLEDPFNGDMSATGWFLFIGMILLFFYAWSRILAMIVRS